MSMARKEWECAGVQLVAALYDFLRSSYIVMGILSFVQLFFRPPKCGRNL